MFTLSSDAKFQGYTEDGMAVYAVVKPANVVSPLALDPVKLAKAFEDHATVRNLFRC